MKRVHEKEAAIKEIGVRVANSKSTQMWSEYLTSHRYTKMVYIINKYMYTACVQ